MLACAIEGLFLGVILYKCAKKVFKKNEELDDPEIELTLEAITSRMRTKTLVVNAIEQWTRKTNGSRSHITSFASDT